MSGSRIDPDAEIETTANDLRVVGLFSGVGGIEQGFRMAGAKPVFLCEIDAFARRVLSSRFRGVEMAADVSALRGLPACDVLVAGFPCQDLSPAGRTAGIGGSQSGLVDAMFRLVKRADRRPDWIVIENVPFMLQLDRGKAMAFVTGWLGELGYAWAYRIVDSRSFGLPQRRRRVLLVASRSGDPRAVLLGRSETPTETAESTRRACGFYWTEGNTGVGWAVDAVPPLKGGSGVGIASPPAIWLPNDLVVTPEIRDAERLQGFDADWTISAEGEDGRGRRTRWKLVGNAVSVPVARWVAERIAKHAAYDFVDRQEKAIDSRWPYAAWGHNGRVVIADLGSAVPVSAVTPHLDEFIRYPTTPLSRRAAHGFLTRAQASRLHFEPGFLESLELHIDRMLSQEAAA